MDASHGCSLVWVRGVHGVAVVERHATSRHLDEDGFDHRELLVLEQVLGLIVSEDVHEPPHAESVGAGQVAHRSALDRRAVERHPCGERVGLGDRPVRLILVRVGDATAGLLVQGLVVPEAHRRSPQQLRREARYPRVERERPDVLVVLPQVDALHEGLLVPALLLDGSCIGARAGRDRVVGGRAELLQLRVGQYLGNDHEAVALERLDRVRVQKVAHGPRDYAAFAGAFR